MDYHLLKRSICVSSRRRGGEDQGVCAVTGRVCASAGIPALSHQRGPSADPTRPGLGASGGGAICGPGGLLTQQVDGTGGVGWGGRFTWYLADVSATLLPHCCVCLRLRCKQEEVEQKAAQSPKGTVTLYR